MAADQIDGQRNNKSQKQAVNGNGRCAWINADDQGQADDEFQEGNRNGNQIDRNFREKAVSVNNFGKIRRR